MPKNNDHEADEPLTKKQRHSSSSNQSDSSSSSAFSIPTPPDGGWGWIVVFGSFICHLIADGIGFSFGVIYANLLEQFGESKAKTSWVASLFLSVPLIAAPIGSALTNKYGCRTVTMCGGFVAMFGFFLSYFVTSIEMLCVTIGLISGLGLSVVYVAAIIVVAYYFETKRAFATGLAVSGSGIGTFVFAPLTEFLMGKYGWRGTILILGGIMLNIVVAGALFRPLETKRDKKRKRYLRSLAKFSRQNSTISMDDINQIHIPLNGSASINDNCIDLDMQKHSMLNDPVTQSLMTLPTYYHNDHINRDVEVIHEDNDEHFSGSLPHIADDSCNVLEISQSHSVSLCDEQFPICNVPRKNSPDKLINSTPAMSNGPWKQNTIRKTPDTLTIQPMYRKDIFYRGSLVRIPRFKTSSSCPNIHVKTKTEATDTNILSIISVSSEVKQILKEMMDITILKNLSFIMFCVSNIILYMWYDVVYVYVTDRAINQGHSEALSSLLISIIGIVNTIGQVIFGVIGDHPKVNSLFLYMTAIIICGVSVIVIPLCYNYPLLATATGGFGFFIASNYSLTTIILVDLVGMGRLTNAMGLVMMAQGISNLIGPPLAGKISDDTGSYDAAFYASGAFIVLSGALLLLIPCLSTLCKGTDTVVDTAEHQAHSNGTAKHQPSSNGTNGYQSSSNGTNGYIRTDLNNKKETSVTITVV
ncbi:unnamed protein product [Owenia fusiformis]|uniref:Uncharacterized protein n=1 Tax=Owenia fusiformis TaxID=6347 RepID=A0A8J1Y7B3_OWEFU|nr:unnamed protein product [Owenia fusiformis]